MGLPSILIFSALTGISFSFAIRAGVETSGAGLNFVVLDFFSRLADPTVQSMVVIISSIFAIFFIFRLAKFFRQVIENRLLGIITSALGFSGSFLVMLAPQDNSHLLFLGIAIWSVGAIVVIFYKKKN